MDLGYVDITATRELGPMQKVEKDWFGGVAVRKTQGFPFRTRIWLQGAEAR